MTQIRRQHEQTSRIRRQAHALRGAAEAARGKVDRGDRAGTGARHPHQRADRGLRPLVACADRQTHRRRVPGRAAARLHRLAVTPGTVAREAGRARAEGLAQGLSHGAVPAACVVTERAAEHRAAAAGPALLARRVEGHAVQPVVAGVPAHAAVVAQRHDRSARRVAPPRRRGHVHHAPVARHGLAEQLRRHQPRGAAPNLETMGTTCTRAG